MSNDENPWRGVTLYDWVPFFKEISQKLAEIGGLPADNRDQRMKELAQGVFEGGAILNPEYAPINPFSFIYTLASKNNAEQAVRLMDGRGFFSRAKDAFGVASPVPTDGIFPVPPAVNTLVGGNLTAPAEVNDMWSVFTTVAGAENYTALSNEAFLGCVSKRGISTRNLSQCLFLINPDCYLPLDDNGFLPLCRMHPMGREMSVDQLIRSIERGDLQFHDIIETSRNMFPGCKPYEINHFAYSYLRAKARVVISDRYWQISSNVYDDEKDRFHDFKEKGAVWIGGANEGDNTFQQPDIGDIMLVRYGRQKGHAIGIVLDNQYRRCDSYREDATIRVVFLNVRDHPANLAKKTPIDRISRAHEKTISAFEGAPEFEPTIAFLRKLQSNGETGAHATQKSMTNSTLNRIFYGPPGTGKTFRTTSAAVEILDPGFYAENKGEDDRQKLRERFVELRERGRVEFVTFHQSFGYEEFVEGIRPVMGEEQGQEIAYEIAPGVFKRICEAAKHDATNRYVLIIDEINRGNISRIFGELITLIEESKRAGGSDEISVTLPYSKESFTVPANLHIIGTMNTADRSIALLDTALRRRFKFTEMMPDSSKLADVVIDGVNVSAMLSAINERIEAMYDRDHQIGHTYFLELKKCKTIESLSGIFRDDILPLLQEYFYDDWEKINVVLNDNGFVVKSGMPRMKSADSVNRDKSIWRIAGEDALSNPGNYIKIYETQSESPQNEAE